VRKAVKSAFLNLFREKQDMAIFVFDLDSTVTRAELLPEIARIAGMDVDMARLTQQALDGTAPFAVSFRQRFDLLRHVGMETVRQAAEGIEVDEYIGGFIRERPGQCIIATGNADLWVKPITDKLGCRVFASHAELDEHGVPRLLSVLHKGDVLRALRSELPETKIIAIGDSANDIPMFELADYAIAYGGVNTPTAAVREAADEQIDDGGRLVTRLLELCGR
ncbi:MAG: HAD family phosphatase, partial [Desulfovibrionaceae bacterium]|nr:HAD family phosphatase [Desulfovibrionaceae bacterium]